MLGVDEDQGVTATTDASSRNEKNGARRRPGELLQAVWNFAGTHPHRQLDAREVATALGITPRQAGASLAKAHEEDPDLLRHTGDGTYVYGPVGESAPSIPPDEPDVEEDPTELIRQHFREHPGEPLAAPAIGTALGLNPVVVRRYLPPLAASAPELRQVGRGRYVFDATSDGPDPAPVPPTVQDPPEPPEATSGRGKPRRSRSRSSTPPDGQPTLLTDEPVEAHPEPSVAPEGDSDARISSPPLPAAPPEAASGRRRRSQRSPDTRPDPPTADDDVMTILAVDPSGEGVVLRDAHGVVWLARRAFSSLKPQSSLGTYGSDSSA